MKRVVLILFISFFMLPLSVKADTYKVDNYDVNIVVSEYKELDITETITTSTDFTREIPLINNNYDDNNNNIKTISKFKLINVNSKYKKIKRNNMIYLKLNNNDTNTYVINYKLDLGNDYINNYDVLLYEIIPNNINAKNVSFNIKMPYQINKNNIQFNNNIDYEIKDNNIIGNINNLNQSLNIKINLYEGYFSKSRITLNQAYIDDLKDFIITLIPLFIIIIIFTGGINIYYNFFYKRHKNITIKYSLPSYFTPSEVGYLYSKKINKNQIISLILYCFNQGYFNIYEENNNLYIEKLKDFDKYEKEYIKIAFKDTFINNNKILLENVNMNINEALESLKYEYDYLNDDSIKIYSVLLFFNFLLTILSSFIVENIILISIMMLISLLSIILAYKIIKGKIILNEDDYKKMIDSKGFKICLENLTKKQLLILINNYPVYFYVVYQYAYVYDLNDKWKNLLKDENIKMTNNINLNNIIDFDKNIK